MPVLAVAIMSDSLRHRNSARIEHSGIDRLKVAAAVALELVAEPQRQRQQLSQPCCWVVDWIGSTAMFFGGLVAPAGRGTLRNAVKDHARTEG